MPRFIRFWTPAQCRTASQASQQQAGSSKSSANGHSDELHQCAAATGGAGSSAHLEASVDLSSSSTDDQMAFLKIDAAGGSNKEALTWLDTMLQQFNDSYRAVAGFEKYTAEKLASLLERCVSIILHLGA